MSYAERNALEAKEPSLYGEIVEPGFFDRAMEWVDFEEGADRVETTYFLGRYGNRVCYCAMNEEADVFWFDTDRPLQWHRAEPDAVLVPMK